MNFKCFSLSPITLAHSGLAVATSRAGGIGLLDAEFCPVSQIDRALQNLEQLLTCVQSNQAIGLRLRAEQLESHAALLECLGGRSHWLILSGWQSHSLAVLQAGLPASGDRTLLLEILKAEQINKIPADQDIGGLVARGHECGGWVGEDSSLILTQKLLKQTAYPVYVQGGMGVHTAAACRAAGAAGVVLDDQLWLMPESPLDTSWQSLFAPLSGQEATTIGELLNAPCRVLVHPQFKASANLQTLAKQIEVKTSDARHAAFQWRRQASAYLGWGSPEDCALPIGQAVGLAAQYRDRFCTTGRLIQAILDTQTTHLELANQLRPLQENSPLAQSHRTTYPIVQGPMTRVSDTAMFANAVADAGGLPMLALALMRGDQVRMLLRQTQSQLGDRSWGIGILGFVPHALRTEQLAAVMEVKPAFALIAGGRPDQAQKLESVGIATYLHVPTPRLLQLFLEQGARRFVFEGRECGGHVGPLSSLVLWESMIEQLLAAVPAGSESQIHVLFAGGIHDARSAAMISAMAAPLAARGMNIGVLMGTAYLFTQEAVSCGAVLSEFQQVAIACQRTVNLETGPGHASRCAVTPFAEEFDQTRRQMLMQQRSPDEIKNTLEDLTLGRLRIASKGLMRNDQGQLTSADVDQQRQQGMYMIGQVATLRDRTCRIVDLHRDVSVQSAALLAEVCHPSADSAIAVLPADIAIIGIGTLLPKAQHPEVLWKNILANVNALTEIPAHRWDWRLYYDSDRSARDKVYSKWGGFLEDVAFDPLRFGIPPKSLKSIEPLQLLTLETVRLALADAGYASGEFDREQTSVILGAGGGIADLGQQYAVRSEIPRFVDAPTAAVWDRLPEWTEESFPGLLLNVAAGRVANRFDLGGANFTVDAACASSLAAINLAVKELESGRSNLAIAGGIDTVQSPFAYLCFSKTQALTPSGQPRPFDQSADGIAISEGLAIVVLKRLTDAERDGDRIYAVIKAVEGSSDGKALGMTAPLPAGQRRALTRAYRKAGFSPNTLGLYEAHGTGTAAGDRAELETITGALTAADAPANNCAIGSVKSLIGHTKCTAGVAGLIKSALALYHKVLPGHAGVETPLAPLTDPDAPVYLLPEAQPWFSRPDYPRRAAVSAFGFGGTNFHAVLEEHQATVPHQRLGSDRWTVELIVIRTASREALIQEIRGLLEAFLSGAEPRVRDLARSYAKRADDRWQEPVCLSLVVEDIPQLQTALAQVLEHLQSESVDPKTLPPHIQLVWNATVQDAAIAFVFPGQGSQYPNMAREMALYFHELREAVEFADQQLQSQLPKQLSQLIYPVGAYSEAVENQQKRELMDTCVAQPAIGAIEMGFMALMKRLKLEPAMVCGHSYGEYAALHCAGVLSRKDFIALSATRGRVMATACAAADGAMAAVQETRENLQSHLSGVQGVVIANHNAPCQTVISGEKQVVDRVVDNLNAAGVMAKMLPVAGAFHSALVASAKTALASAIADAAIQPPQLPVYANATARPYPSDPDQIRQDLTEHLVNPVNFVGQIQAMHTAGARIFVELGPKQILTGLIHQILADQDYTAVPLDGRQGLRGYLMAIATILMAGGRLQLSALYDDRDAQLLDLDRLVESTRKPPHSPMTCFVHGGGVRSPQETVAQTGKLPPLTLETAAAATPSVSLVADRVTTAAAAPAAPAAQPPLLPSQPITALPKPTVQVTPPSSFKSNPSVAKLSESFIQSPITANNRNGHSMTHAQSHNSNHADYPIESAISPIPAYPQGSQRTAMPAEVALAAYQAYQETMHHFLNLQEQVMKQFLGGGVDPALPQSRSQSQFQSRSMPTIAPLPASGTMGYPPRPSNGSSANGTHTPEFHAAPMPHLSQVTENHASAVSLPPVAPPRAEAIPMIPAVNAPVQSTPLSAPLSAQPAVPIAPPPIAEPVAKPTAETASSLDRAGLTEKLVQIVSDRTGYPTTMLGLEQDIEAELGIDSIKRVEILGALQKQLPEPIAATVQAQMESLTRVKSLSALVEQLLKVDAAPEKEPSLGKF